MKHRTEDLIAIFNPITLSEAILSLFEILAATWLYENDYVWASGLLAGACIGSFISRRLSFMHAAKGLGLLKDKP